MERIDYYPVGSIVLLKGGTQKLMIVGRGLLVQNGNDIVFFDYSGVIYPDGLVGENVAYFNHDAISRVIFEGYSDEESENAVDNINEYLSTNDIKKGNPENWVEN